MSDNPLENLFKFPIIMIDGNKEEEKEKRGEMMALDPGEPDMIIGYAECPYYDFLSITDRWLPTNESYERALDRKFDACGVVFLNAGTYVVPWTRSKFKSSLKRFINRLPQKTESNEPEIRMVRLSKDELLDQLTREDDGK